MISVDGWKARGHFASLASRNIFYIDSGGADKPAVLLIHGFPTASWDWQKLWELLQGDFRLVALDLLGFGFSNKPTAHRYRIAEQADIVEALAKRLRLESFHVLAHDYGDTVAQELLARQVDGRGVGRWLSLCLLNGGLFPETHRPRLVQRLLLTPLGPLIARLMSRRRFERSFSAVFAPDSRPSEAELAGFWQLVNYNGGRLVYHRLITYMRERRQNRSRWVGALQQSPVPVGLINGSLDPVSGAHMVARYRSVVRDTDFIAELPTVGHYPQVEAPEAVAEHYRQFVASATASLTTARGD